MKQSNNSNINLFIAALLFVTLTTISTNYITKRVITTASINGQSMYPYLKNNETMNLIKTDSNYERGDIVVFNAASEVPKKYVKSDDETYIKRVIGVEGDKVESKQDGIYVNDKKIDESYLSEENKVAEIWTLNDLSYGQDWQDGIVKDNKVPKDCYFVLGDNRPKSYDSRRFGFIKKESILGKTYKLEWYLKKEE